MEKGRLGDKMRIVMTITNPFKPDPRVYKEAKSLVGHGYEVMIIAWDREGKCPREEIVDGIKIRRIRVKARYGNFLNFVLKLPLFYIKAMRVLLRSDFDIIHTHDFDTAPLGFLIKCLRKKKWVYDIHDLYFTFFSMEDQRKSVLSKIVQKFDVFFAKFADIDIVATQSIGGKHKGLREYYIKSGITPEKVITIWNVPDVREFLNYPELKLRKSNKFTIGFIGGQRTLSNFIILFRALEGQEDSYKVLLVGEGKSTKKLKEIVRKEYPNLEVEFIGNVPYKLIPSYYLLCDVIYAYYPPRENIKRAIAIKVFEAAILGIPVIVNGDSLMEDFVKLYRCGVSVDSLSKNELTKVLRKVKKIKFHSNYIRQKWSWENEEKKLLKIYGGIYNESSLSIPSY